MILNTSTKTRIIPVTLRSLEEHVDFTQVAMALDSFRTQVISTFRTRPYLIEPNLDMFLYLMSWTFEHYYGRRLSTNLVNSTRRVLSQLHHPGAHHESLKAVAVGHVGSVWSRWSEQQAPEIVHGILALVNATMTTEDHNVLLNFCAARHPCPGLVEAQNFYENHTPKQFKVITVVEFNRPVVI